MDALECIATRRSIRKFKDTPVEWDKVVKILEAGRMAPAAGNIQNWRFIVVREYANRKKVAQACYDQQWMEDAPIIIVVVAEPDKAERFYGARGERLYTIQNCAAAIENMLLAAHAEGLGSCWIGAFDESKLRSICQLPEYIMPHAIVPVGYADEKPLLPQKQRVEFITRLEIWQGRRKYPYRGYISQLWPKLAEGAKETVKKHLKKLTKE